MVESSLLRKYSLFGGLMDDQIHQILPLMEKKSYGPGQEIIIQGEPNDKLSFILEGRVQAKKDGVAVWEFGEGEFFGEMEMLDIMPSAATVTALAGTTVLTLSNKDLHEIYKHNINIFSLIIMNLARELSRRIRRMSEKMTFSGGLP